MCCRYLGTSVYQHVNLVLINTKADYIIILYSALQHLVEGNFGNMGVRSRKVLKLKHLRWLEFDKSQILMLFLKFKILKSNFNALMLGQSTS